MAHKFNDVVNFNLAGVGIMPGIVLTSRLEQIPGTQDTEEVLTVLYAHPDDEQHAVHKAKDIGDVKFTLKPASDTNHFGWSTFGPEVPQDEKVAALLTELNDRQTALDQSEAENKQLREEVASLQKGTLPPDSNGSDGAIVFPGTVGPMDTEGGAYPEDKVDAVPASVEPAAESVPEPVPEEVFADPEGRTIGVPDAAGGYVHIRDNPFPPSAGQGDLTGVPIA